MGKEVKCYHKKKDCDGTYTYCCFHNPSDHHMKDWPMTIRDDRGMMTERICPHGVGHPDPDSMAWMKRTGSEDTGIHGCDGCCTEEKK